MKHFVLVLVTAVVGYAAWALSDERTRTVALLHIGKHGVRLGAIALILVLLLLAATQIPSTPIV